MAVGENPTTTYKYKYATPRHQQRDSIRTSSSSKELRTSTRAKLPGSHSVSRGGTPLVTATDLRGDFNNPRTRRRIQESNNTQPNQDAKATSSLSYSNGASASKRKVQKFASHRLSIRKHGSHRGLKTPPTEGAGQLLVQLSTTSAREKRDLSKGDLGFSHTITAAGALNPAGDEISTAAQATEAHPTDARGDRTQTDASDRRSLSDSSCHADGDTGEQSRKDAWSFVSNLSDAEARGDNRMTLPRLRTLPSHHESNTSVFKPEDSNPQGIRKSLTSVISFSRSRTEPNFKTSCGTPNGTSLPSPGRQNTQARPRKLPNSKSVPAASALFSRPSKGRDFQRSLGSAFRGLATVSKRSLSFSSRSIRRERVIPKEDSGSSGSPKEEAGLGKRMFSKRKLTRDKSASIQRPKVSMNPSAPSVQPEVSSSRDGPLGGARKLLEGRQRLVRTITAPEATARAMLADVEDEVSTSAQRLVALRRQMARNRGEGGALRLDTELRPDNRQEKAGTGQSLRFRRKSFINSPTLRTRVQSMTAKGSTRVGRTTPGTPRRRVVRSYTEGTEREGHSQGKPKGGQLMSLGDLGSPVMSNEIRSKQTLWSEGGQVGRSLGSAAQEKIPGNCASMPLPHIQSEGSLLVIDGCINPFSDGEGHGKIGKTSRDFGHLRLSCEEIQGLVQEISEGRKEERREAARKLRLLTRDPEMVSSLTAVSGGVELFLSMLELDDRETQEYATTSVLNMSLERNARAQLCLAGALQRLTSVLECGSSRAKANAAAALFSLMETEELKAEVGRTTAVDSLVQLAIEDPPARIEETTGARSVRSARRDALKALLKLADSSSVRQQLVHKGVVEMVVKITSDGDEESEEISTALLAKLVRVEEGRDRALRAQGTEALVEVVELGCTEAREYATSALHTLAFSSTEGQTAVKRCLSLSLLGLLKESGCEKTRKKAVQLSVLLWGDV